jgi:hypothetical protein
MVRVRELRTAGTLRVMVSSSAPTNALAGGVNTSRGRTISRWSRSWAAMTIWSA